MQRSSRAAAVGARSCSTRCHSCWRCCSRWSLWGCCAPAAAGPEVQAAGSRSADLQAATGAQAQEQRGGFLLGALKKMQKSSQPLISDE